MNRTIKEATVKRLHYESHDRLQTHLTDFIATYNYSRRLKTLGSRLVQIQNAMIAASATADMKLRASLS